MPLGAIDGGIPSPAADLRVTPQQRIPVIDPRTLQPVGWLENISLKGVMILSRESFVYRRLHDVRFALGQGAEGIVDAGIELIWAKAAADSYVANGFAIRRIAPVALTRLRFWIDQHRHERSHRSNRLPCANDPLGVAGI